jgi:hypothetical protein
MKRQIILAVALVFTMVLFAPAVTYAFQTGSPVVVVENKEKKVEKNTTTPTVKKEVSTASETKTCCDKAKACCDKEKKMGCCKGSASQEKTGTVENKACCKSQKVSTDPQNVK